MSCFKHCNFQNKDIWCKSKFLKKYAYLIAYSDDPEQTAPFDFAVCPDM